MSDDTEKGTDQTQETGGGKLPITASTKSAIVSAIHNLDKNDPKHYNKNGEPRIEALTEMCGFKVTRADVVEVWGEEGEGDTQSEEGQAPPIDLAWERQRTEIARQIYRGPESEPIKCLKMFEFLMTGSRNSALKLILDDWRTSRNEAIEIDKRLRARGQH